MVVSNAVAGSASLVTVARRQPQGWPNGCGQNSSMPAGAHRGADGQPRSRVCARLGLSGFGVLVAANWCGDWVTARWSSYSNCGGKNGLISPSGRKGGADSCQVPARRNRQRRVGALTYHSNRAYDAFKWTKASRAKLSRSQKARWKERNSSSVGSAVSVSPANITGISSERGRRTTVSPALGAFFPPFDRRRGQSHSPAKG